MLTVTDPEGYSWGFVRRLEQPLAGEAEVPEVAQAHDMPWKYQPLAVDR